MAVIDDPGPYVVVGLSWGGMIAQQFARTHADDVEGIVLLDSASVYLPETLSPEQWSSWMAIVQGSADAAGSEVPDYPASIAELNGSPRPPEIPATVVSSDEEWDLEVTPGASTWPAWVESQERLAAFWDADHVTDTDSGHGLPVEQPALVTAAILDVVDAVRGR